MSTNTAILAEDIIKDMGAAEDYSDYVIPCCMNSFAMCCHRTPVNQQEIYDALIQNKNIMDGNEDRNISVSSSNMGDTEKSERVKTPGNKLARAKANQNTGAGGSGSTDELVEESGV